MAAGVANQWRRLKDQTDIGPPSGFWVNAEDRSQKLAKQFRGKDSQREQSLYCSWLEAGNVLGSQSRNAKSKPWLLISDKWASCPMLSPETGPFAKQLWNWMFMFLGWKWDVLTPYSGHLRNCLKVSTSQGENVTGVRQSSVTAKEGRAKSSWLMKGIYYKTFWSALRLKHHIPLSLPLRTNPFSTSTHLITEYLTGRLECQSPGKETTTQ